MTDPRYPIGKFEYGKTYSSEQNREHIKEIASLPKELKILADSLNEEQLNKSYREGGWSARQIIHHIADSHMNACLRTKFTLTENNTVIKPYDQDLWAELEDGKNAPVSISVSLIESLHLRWVFLLKRLTDRDLEKEYIHPEYNRTFRLDELLALYAWHGKHHYGHLNYIKNNF